MTDWVAIWKALFIAGVLGYLAGTAAYGWLPLQRRRQKRQIGARERVVYASDVNTELHGYRIGSNHWGAVLWTAAFVLLWILQVESALLVIGCFVYIGALTCQYHRSRPYQKLQQYVLSEQGVYLFPENLGRPMWNKAELLSASWDVITGYKIDGSFLQFAGQDGGIALQVEYRALDYERVKAVLFELGVPRLELSDRLWVAQVDEEKFYALEDEINDLGWDLLDLFHEELRSMNLRPEFGVMRNMPGDRLFEEQARSWLQLNLVDADSSEKVAGGSFPLWHSTGSVGYLLGTGGQELVDRLQEWLKMTLRDAEKAREVVVS
ncbi:hypothetical protein EV586_103372 [Tumebacillus sp. BK434]|uniref:hypothetical protein n=1 Tax=Tumebacillus sp. BK434 TaxID=2512169 RepID=UPI00104F9255|nr:hypothetical protein [Tumebacillus sp. BK434]TCP55718.1 hypothetical protein EV586_103372 [Tumebacillus sp. BK434]